MHILENFKVYKDIRGIKGDLRRIKEYHHDAIANIQILLGVKTLEPFHKNLQDLYNSIIGCENRIDQLIDAIDERNGQRMLVLNQCLVDAENDWREDWNQLRNTIDTYMQNL